MKKLLCVLLFGMVFGQAELTTRGYEIEQIGNNDVIDFNHLLDFEYEYFITKLDNY